jgi:hypothetical protein
MSIVVCFFKHISETGSVRLRVTVGGEKVPTPLGPLRTSYFDQNTTHL